jgi:hypothetical protein
MRTAADVARSVMGAYPDPDSQEWYTASRLVAVLRIVEEHRTTALALGLEPPGLVADIERAVAEDGGAW